jgi:hypothetical protein
MPRSSCGTLSSPCGGKSPASAPRPKRFLDPRQIDDAFAQHRLADQPEFEILLGAGRAAVHGGAARIRRTS